MKWYTKKQLIKIVDNLFISVGLPKRIVGYDKTRCLDFWKRKLGIKAQVIHKKYGYYTEKDKNKLVDFINKKVLKI